MVIFIATLESKHLKVCLAFLLLISLFKLSSCVYNHLMDTLICRKDKKRRAALVSYKIWTVPLMGCFLQLEWGNWVDFSLVLQLLWLFSMQFGCH
jgi:hypothetical protein